MLISIKVFFKLILSFFIGLVRCVQKYTGRQDTLDYQDFWYDMLLYLDFWYVHRPPSHTQSIQNKKFSIP